MLRDARVRLRSEQAGMTLVELLVVAMIGIIVLGAGVVVLITVAGQEPKARERAATLQQARTMTENLTREIREGYGVVSATSSSFVFLSYVHRASCGGSASSTVIACKITYSCSGARCTRAETTPQGSGGTQVEVVSDLASTSVFAYSPTASDPDYVEVKLELDEALTGESITVEDGAALRNTAYTATGS